MKNFFSLRRRLNSSKKYFLLCIAVSAPVRKYFPALFRLFFAAPDRKYFSEDLKTKFFLMRKSFFCARVRSARKSFFYARAVSCKGSSVTLAAYLRSLLPVARNSVISWIAAAP